MNYNLSSKLKEVKLNNLFFIKESDILNLQYVGKS